MKFKKKTIKEKVLIDTRNQKYWWKFLNHKSFVATLRKSIKINSYCDIFFSKTTIYQPKMLIKLFDFSKNFWKENFTKNKKN